MDDAARILGGRYEVGELIGRGGMAEVHIGHDTRLGRTVAIKILRSDLARDPAFQARFRREAQSAAGLNHPAIVAVYDTGEDVVTDAAGGVAHVPFIVMEYVEGHTVRDILRDGAAVPIEEAVEITSGVLSALEYSHHAGIVHRDIKPANVMLTPTGAVKVMDFGIARAMADAAGGMTQTQAVIGTAQYLSPEQARGEQVDSRSDLYSTGCLLFELLTGRPPFIGDSPVAVAYQHARETAPPPSSYASDVPETLDRITVKALAKSRDHRYGTASEFRADLEASQRGGRVNAPALGMLGVGAALGVGAGHPEGGAATQVMGSVGSPPQVPPAGAPWGQVNPTGPTTLDNLGADDEEDKRRPWLMWVLIGIAAAAVIGIVLLFTLGNRGSTDPGMVRVPDVVGMLEEDAVQELKDLDLEVRRFTEISDEYEEGLVTRTIPESGEDVAVGDTVNYWVSLGAESAVVPDVEGMTQAEARAALIDAGFDAVNISTDTEDSPDVPEDSATRTDPPAGDEASRDVEIVLYLSTGRVELPDLTTMSQEQAVTTLNELQLTAVIVQQESDETPGRVLEQSPGPGLVTQHSSVRLTVATERTTTTVPDVVGMTWAQAEATLVDAGLSASRNDVSDPVILADRVVSTNPGAGTTVALHSTVTVNVSTGP